MTPRTVLQIRIDPKLKAKLFETIGKRGVSERIRSYLEQLAKVGKLPPPVKSVMTNTQKQLSQGVIPKYGPPYDPKVMTTVSAEELEDVVEPKVLASVKDVQDALKRVVASKPIPGCPSGAPMYLHNRGFCLCKKGKK